MKMMGMFKVKKMLTFNREMAFRLLRIIFIRSMENKIINNIV
jgi:hypothetical protein